MKFIKQIIKDVEENQEEAFGEYPDPIGEKFSEEFISKNQDITQNDIDELEDRFLFGDYGNAPTNIKNANKTNIRKRQSGNIIGVYNDIVLYYRNKDGNLYFLDINELSDPDFNNSSKFKNSLEETKSEEGSIKYKSPKSIKKTFNFKYKSPEWTDDKIENYKNRFFAGDFGEADSYIKSLNQKNIEQNKGDVVGIYSSKMNKDQNLVLYYKDSDETLYIMEYVDFMTLVPKNWLVSEKEFESDKENDFDNEYKIPGLQLTKFQKHEKEKDKTFREFLNYGVGRSVSRNQVNETLKLLEENPEIKTQVEKFAKDINKDYNDVVEKLTELKVFRNLNINIAFDNLKTLYNKYKETLWGDSMEDKYTFKLSKRKNEYGEYVVRCYKNYKYYDEGSYYTDDWEDAFGSLADMAKRNGLTVKSLGSSFIADAKVTIEDKMVYVFPSLTDEDLRYAKRYGLEFVKEVKDGIALKGDLKNLKRYAEDYIGGYELVEDYLYKEDDFNKMFRDSKKKFIKTRTKDAMQNWEKVNIDIHRILRNAGFYDGTHFSTFTRPDNHLIIEANGDSYDEILKVLKSTDYNVVDSDEWCGRNSHIENGKRVYGSGRIGIIVPNFYGMTDSVEQLSRKLGEKLLPPKEKKKPRYVYEVYWFDTEDCQGDPIFKKFYTKKEQETWYNQHKDDEDKFGMYAEDGYNMYEDSKMKDYSSEHVGNIVTKMYNSDFDTVEEVRHYAKRLNLNEQENKELEVEIEKVFGETEYTLEDLEAKSEELALDIEYYARMENLDYSEKQALKELEKEKDEVDKLIEAKKMKKDAPGKMQELFNRGFLANGSTLRNPKGAELKFKYNGTGKFEEVLSKIEKDLNLKASYVDNERELVNFFKADLKDSKKKVKDAKPDWLDDEVIEDIIYDQEFPTTIKEVAKELMKRGIKKKHEAIGYVKEYLRENPYEFKNFRESLKKDSKKIKDKPSDLTNIKVLKNEGSLYIVEYIPQGSLDRGENKKLYAIIRDYNGEDVWTKGAEICVSYDDALKSFKRTLGEKVERENKSVNKELDDLLFKTIVDFANEQGYADDDADEYVVVESKEYENEDGDKGILIEIRNDLFDYYEVEETLIEKLDKILSKYDSYIEPYSAYVWQAYIWK